jgi:hypothetical protein
MDFEELVSDAREECHAAVEAYLAAQVGGGLRAVASGVPAERTCVTGCLPARIWMGAMPGLLPLSLPPSAVNTSLCTLLSPPACCLLPAACLQSVDVRRGRLIAHAESFVHMLGTAMEGLLNQVGCGAPSPPSLTAGCRLCL